MATKYLIIAMRTVSQSHLFCRQFVLLGTVVRGSLLDTNFAMFRSPAYPYYLYYAT